MREEKSEGLRICASISILMLYAPEGGEESREEAVEISESERLRLSCMMMGCRYKEEILGDGIFDQI